MRHQTIYKWKGAAAAAGLGPPGPGGTRRCRRTLSFVYGLMSHCIDRFHFVFYLYTFHFMLPMCIRLIFLLIFSIFLLFMFLFILFYLYINESPRNGKNNKSLRNHHQNTNERVRRRRVPPAPGSQPWAAAAAPFHLYMVWCLIVLIVFFEIEWKK